MKGNETIEKRCFREVLEDELQLLQSLRSTSKPAPETPVSEPGGNSESAVYESAEKANLAGLAFSGGGIRSATVCLGVIQALVSRRLLSKFDYLSTVSGGGYIGGWLSALIQRETASGCDGECGPVEVTESDVEALQQKLAPHPDFPAGEAPAENSGFAAVEHPAVRYLRRYSNYLTPRMGLSGDTLAMISIVLRNFVVIQLCLVTMLSGVVLVAHFVAALSGLLDSKASTAELYSNFVLLKPDKHLVVCAAALLWTVFYAGRSLATQTNKQQSEQRRESGSRAAQQQRKRVYFKILAFVIAPCFVGAWFFSAYVGLNVDALVVDEERGSHMRAWIVSVAVLYGLAWFLGWFGASRIAPKKIGDSESSDWKSRWPQQLFATLVGGTVLGYLLYECVTVLHTVNQVVPIQRWFLVAFGPPVFVLIISFAATLHLGLAGRSFAHYDREFIARLGGLLLLYAAIWAALFALILYATPFVHWLAGGGLVALAAWAGGSGIGIVLAHGESTGEPGGRGWREWIVRLAPWVFLVGMAVLVTFLAQKLTLNVTLDDHYVRGAHGVFTAEVAELVSFLQSIPIAELLAICLAAIALFLVVIFFVDLNLFSLHAIYCNRLSRAYIGASRGKKRRPNPFSGFDPHDDLPLAALRKQRPIHIINTSINSTGGDDLAWQTRRAASFALTPAWSGYETRGSQGDGFGRYVPTERYANGRGVGTWVSVSGAAASPNMGYHTSAAVAGLLTAFNMRLGRWCGNTDPNSGNEMAAKISPRLALAPILAELRGSANMGADWINLTDGGHFENLGVYELVRRRCKLIVVVDAGCDGNHQFDDLANMIRKCWVDFGVNVCFEEMSDLRLGKGKRETKAHFALGKVEYTAKDRRRERATGINCDKVDSDDDDDQDSDGVILYIKSSMTGSEWPDIRQYADKNTDFPHQTTADQFFDEDQFEAYRHLGYKMMAETYSSLRMSLGTFARNSAAQDKTGEWSIEQFVRLTLAYLKDENDDKKTSRFANRG